MQFGVPLLLFAAVLAVTTEMSILRQNPGRTLGRRHLQREPGPEAINRVLVAAMGAMGAVELTHVMGYWSFALFFAVMMAPLALRLRHNRTVAAAQ